MDEPAPFPWIEYLESHYGEHEIRGYKNNPFIVSMFKHTSYQANNDETPWCAACACTALEETGFTSPHRADAVSFVPYGTHCDLKPGCVVVLEFASGDHHVTFCEHIVNDTQFAGIGGNQSDEIKTSVFDRKWIIATRWPVIRKSE